MNTLNTIVKDIALFLAIKNMDAEKDSKPLSIVLTINVIIAWAEVLRSVHELKKRLAEQKELTSE